MKKFYLITLAGIIIAFGTGLLTGRMIYHQPSKELCLGLPEHPGSESFIFEPTSCINNLAPDDEIDIDNLWFLLSSAPQVKETVSYDTTADYLVVINSTKKGIAFIHDYIWLTKDGAMIGDPDLATNTIQDARHLTEDTLNYLSDFIERHQ